MAIAEIDRLGASTPDVDEDELYPTVIFNPQKDSLFGEMWISLQRIHRSRFGIGSPMLHVEDFYSSTNTVVLLGNHKRRLIGYVIAKSEAEKDPNVSQVAIPPAHENRASLRAVLQTLEHEFRDVQGHSYMEGNFTVLSGQADIVQEICGNRVVEARDFFADEEVRMPRWLQRFLRISLAPPNVIPFPGKA